MGDPAQRIATYDDVRRAPEEWTAEILDGELYLSPRPASEHADAFAEMLVELRGRFGRRRGGGPGGWWILGEPELHLGDPDPTSVVVVPDLAGWRRERMPEVPRVSAFTLVPDWVCEILSPGPRNLRKDRVLKPDVYARAGVRHLWFVDPIGMTLEVWRLEAAHYVRIAAFSGDTLVRAEPFDAVELDIGAWWLPTAG